MVTTYPVHPTPAGTTATATDFVALSERLQRGAPAPRAALLERSRAAYQRLGLPDRRHEDWRYASLAPLARGRYELAPSPPEAPDRDALRRAFVGGAEVLRLVFVDGHFDPTLSSPGADRIGLGLLDAALAADASSDLGLGPVVDGVEALAGSLLQEGAALYVPRGVTLGTPIQIVHAVAAARPDALVAPRSRIVLAEGAAASVLETYVHLGSGASLALPLAELVLGPGARLEHHRLALGARAGLHLATTRARLERGASLESGSYAFGGALTRERMTVELAGEGAECTLRGLYTARGEGHADCDLLVDHQVPHATSRQEYRGLLDGRGRGSFHGRVIVRPGAQKALARQSNRNLLLSREARADTRPQLEIFADDVQCTHGATIGQLDADALFYLRSRGLDETFARGVLAHGFAAEVVQHLPWTALRERVESELERFLVGDGDAARERVR